MHRRILGGLAVVLCAHLHAQQDFRIPPYLQAPGSNGMTLVWFSGDSVAGRILYREAGTGPTMEKYSIPRPAPDLAYPLWEDTTFFPEGSPAPPFRHVVRLDGLRESTRYEYSVSQGTEEHGGTFRTAPAEGDPVRIILFGDSETEPESTGKHARWADPVTGETREYLVDQTTGFRMNLEVIRDRDPDLVMIAGDLVESGGEQRDWDEFWKHLHGYGSGPGVAATIPVVAAPGNHEYYAGPSIGQYEQPFSELAIRKYLTYFEPAADTSRYADPEGRYHALEYGPACFLFLDVCDQGPNLSPSDTNFRLLGEGDPGGGKAPGFLTGTRQHDWLLEKLEMARDRFPFIFVVLHHTPYSSGPHGRPAGTGTGEDTQSGVPVRQLVPLFMEYGVDALFCGHDEMWERSVVEGERIGAGGERVPHSIHIYDLGVGGDGLRGPNGDADNPARRFLAHSDSPEMWEDSVLVSGGKHYGHLELEIVPVTDTLWEARLIPVYILPVKQLGDSLYTGAERRSYADTVRILKPRREVATGTAGLPRGSAEEITPGLRCSPNPFTGPLELRFPSGSGGTAFIQVFDPMGRRVFQDQWTVSGPGMAGYVWDGRDRYGRPLPRGIYWIRAGTREGARFATGVVRL